MRLLLRLAAVLILLGLYFAVVLWYSHTLVPPKTVDTVEEFLSWRPSTDQFRIHKHENETFVEAVGSRSRLLASGPSGYVFDQDGAMVDWTIDTGESVDFQRRWRDCWDSERVSREQAMEVLDSAAEAR